MALTVVIIGASGDLTARKLIPALYALSSKARLPEDIRIVGVARSPMSDEDFRSRMEDAIRSASGKEWNASRWTEFSRRLFYVPADATRREGIEHLKAWLIKADEQSGGTALYYLAVAPDRYGEIATRLGEAGMNREDGGWKRL